MSAIWETVQEDLYVIVTAWLGSYIGIHFVYYILGGGMAWLALKFQPDAPTNVMSKSLMYDQMKMSEYAFPLYATVPVFGSYFHHKGWSRLCDSVEECGGVGQSAINFVFYIFMVEAGVFFVHYWMLHKWNWGKENMRHSVHHQFKHADEMNIWTGYAFEAVDGFSQGMPFVICQFIIPIPLSWSTAIGLFVGIWTLYIHLSEPKLPWPFMGADYHYIHHVYNNYNFGLFTQFWDGVFGVLKHPETIDKHMIKKLTKDNAGKLDFATKF